MHWLVSGSNMVPRLFLHCLNVIMRSSLFYLLAINDTVGEFIVGGTACTILSLKVKTRLRDPAYGLPLATGASTCNLLFTF